MMSTLALSNGAGVFLKRPRLLSGGLSFEKRSQCANWTFKSGFQCRLSLTLQSRRGSAGAIAEGTMSTEKEEADELVDQLLAMVQTSDRGAALRSEQHQNVSNLICKLQGLDVPPEPLQSPLIFGDWDVEYCSNPTAPGGYYRSALGRLFLQTESMIQTVEEPDFVGNSVSFALLGIIKGKVSLKGKLVPLDKKWIEITFDPPSLKLGPIKTQYGGSSKVKISVLYVDEKVRLGRGSRGSLFVFKRR